MAKVFDRLKTALSDRDTIEWELGGGGVATVYLAQDVKLRPYENRSWLMELYVVLMFLHLMVTPTRALARLPRGFVA